MGEEVKCSPSGEVEDSVCPNCSSTRHTVYGLPWCHGLLWPAASQLWSPGEVSVSSDFKRL